MHSIFIVVLMFGKFSLIINLFYIFFYRFIHSSMIWPKTRKVINLEQWWHFVNSLCNIFKNDLIKYFPRMSLIGFFFLLLSFVSICFCLIICAIITVIYFVVYSQCLQVIFFFIYIYVITSSSSYKRANFITIKRAYTYTYVSIYIYTYIIVYLYVFVWDVTVLHNSKSTKVMDLVDW